MKAFQSLIRLHRWQADEKRRALADLEAMRADLLARHEAIGVEIKAEQAVQGEPVVQFSYGTYLRSAMARRQTLAKSIAEIEREIADRREELSDAVRELKKFEIAAERRAERAQVELNRRESNEADEVALNVFRRHS